jgi:hypothetical protein
MSQKNREPFSVDINNKETVSTTSYGSRISKATWNPEEGAQRAIAAVEAQIKAEHQRKLDAYNTDPTVQRVGALEVAVERLRQQVEALVLTLENKKL